MTKKSKKSRSVLFSITPIETLESQTSAIPSDLIYSNIITVLKEHGIKAIRTPNKDIFGIYDAFTSRVVQKQNIQAKRAIKSALSSISKTRNIISPRHTITVSNIRNNSVEDLFNAISFSMVYSGYDASEPEVQKLERAKDELDKIYKFANNLEKQYNSKNFTLDTVRIRLSKSLNRDVYFAPLSFDSVRLISSKTTLLKFALLEKVLKQINTIQEESPNKPIIYRVHFSFVETLQQLLVTEYIDPRIDIQISLNMFEKKPSHQQQKSLKLLANNTKNKVSFYISSQSMAVNPLLKKTDIAYVLFSSNVEQLKNQSQSFEIFYNEILSTTKVKNIPLYVESTNKSSK
ncbi:MAG: hypothetical protein DRQ78_01325 [Epsilonproteobacteria bacterium]|nr:MAG: hypothetical protein DRQ78_01325 [Campylobacterota bacterium]